MTMTTGVRNLYLYSYLEPLAPYIERDDITDIYVNRPGEIWLEALGGTVERHDVPNMDADTLRRLAAQIASLNAQAISRENPILSAALPGGERVQIILPPATRGDIAIAIRKHVHSKMRIDAYTTIGAFDNTRVVSPETIDDRPNAINQACDPAELLRNAVRERKNILISGGTSSGKTTFLNALLAEIPMDERLILIEDTPELQLEHENSVGLLAARGGQGDANVNTEDLLVASLRMRPDRIILGEIRGGEAATFLRSVNTGHPGSMTTIHADSPARAIDQLALLVLQTGMRLVWEDVQTYVRRSLDLIVQLKRGKSGRIIHEILDMRGTAAKT